MAEESEFELENRPRTGIILAAGGTRTLLDRPGEVLRKVEEATASEWIEFNSFHTLGAPPRPTLDPAPLWIQGGQIVGIIALTKAWWEDQLRDAQQAALGGSASIAGMLGIREAGQ